MSTEAERPRRTFHIVSGRPFLREPFVWQLKDQVSEHTRKALFSSIVAVWAFGYNPVVGIALLAETGHQLYNRRQSKHQFEERLQIVEQEKQQFGSE